MKRIDRKYAIIYVDTNGDTLLSEDNTSHEMITDYYNNGGFLQWNFYLIIAKECIKNVEGITAAEHIKIIEKNDNYTRKYVVPKAEIKDFLKKQFPIMQKARGKMNLILADTFWEAKKLAMVKKSKNILLYSSYNRYVNLDLTLHALDALRNDLINNPKMVGIFYTHIQNEYSLAEKKFKLFK